MSRVAALCLLGSAALAALHVPSALPASKQSFIEIEVKKGDTLTVIARRYLDDPRKWRELLQYNNIPKPNLILPGLKLKVPGYLARKPVANVARFSPSAEYSSGARGDWSDVERDLGLYNQDRLRTDGSGLITLLLADAGSLLIRPGSYVVLSQTKKSKTDVGVLLQRGRLESFLPRENRAGRKVTIETPAAVVSVRGTRFATRVDKDGNTSVACERGEVAVAAQGKTVLLPAGFAVVVKKGEAPGTPFTMLKPPQVQIRVP